MELQPATATTKTAESGEKAETERLLYGLLFSLLRTNWDLTDVIANRQ